MALETRMQWSFVCLVVILISQCNGQLATTKDASLTCIKREATNQLEMTFNLALNSDPTGALWGINNSIYETNGNVDEIPCTNTYNSTNKVYKVVSIVDLSTASTNDANVCGRITKTVNGQTTYEWLLFHLVGPPANPSMPTFIQGRDRAYRVVCTVNSLTSDRLTSSVTVLTPGLNVDVTPAALPVALTIQRKDGNTYTDITGGTVNAGSLVRLRAVFSRPSPYTQYIDVHSIYIYDATVRGNALPNTYTLVDSNGCANTGNNQPPFRPNCGFKGTFSGTDNVHVTCDFIIWKFDESSQLIFQVYFRTCLEPNITLCQDPCKENTGTTEPAARRRRQADDEEPGVLSVVLNVVEEPTTTAESSSDVTMMVIVGATVGGAVLVIVALLVCCVVLRNRRRYEEKRSDYLGAQHPAVIIPYGQKY